MAEIDRQYVGLGFGSKSFLLGTFAIPPACKSVPPAKSAPQITEYVWPDALT